MTKQTYTIRELAALLGVTYTAVSNAKYQRPKSPKPGTASYAVMEGMRERGITWEQVTIWGEAEVQRDAEAPPEQAQAAPVAATAPVAPHVEEGSSAPPAQPVTQERPTHVLVVDLAPVPLEALVGEIVRRMPRAEVVLRGGEA